MIYWSVEDTEKGVVYLYYLSITYSFTLLITNKVTGTYAENNAKANG